MNEGHHDQHGRYIPPATLSGCCAAKDARIAELEAELAFMTRERDAMILNSDSAVKSRNHARAEIDVYKRAFERGSKVAEAVTNATSLDEAQRIAQEWLDE